MFNPHQCKMIAEMGSRLNDGVTYFEQLSYMHVRIDVAVSDVRLPDFLEKLQFLAADIAGTELHVTLKQNRTVRAVVGCK